MCDAVQMCAHTYICTSPSHISSHRIIHENGFTRDECKMYRPVVYSNTVQSLAAIIKGMDQLGVDFNDAERRVCYPMRACSCTSLVQGYVF